jgi:pyruvate formate lyase activating enzyme
MMGETPVREDPARAIRGLITNVQRFSIHDGPGIRTTVFLKGCPLSCFWCHNPEDRRPGLEVQWFPDRCIGCAACVAACPQGAQAVDDGVRVYHRELCLVCGQCVEVCYADGLVMAGRWWEPGELLELLLRDGEFYDQSGGGVTLSGGEPLLQYEFSRRILELCRAAGLRTAIETAAYGSWEHLSSLLPWLDLLMTDIKHMDDAVHRAVTGVPNHSILQNARRLAGSGVPMIIRTPVVPGVNDTPEAIGAIAGFIREFPNLRYYELMPFHRMAGGKYRSLGLDYAAAELTPPDAERMQALADCARAAGVADVRIA